MSWIKSATTVEDFQRQDQGILEEVFKSLRRIDQNTCASSSCALAIKDAVIGSTEYQTAKIVEAIELQGQKTRAVLDKLCELVAKNSCQPVAKVVKAKNQQGRKRR